MVPAISAGYFGQVAKSNALTHLWSISVESQFYLLYTIAFLLREQNHIFRRIGLFLYSVLGISSFTYFIYSTSPASYFSLFTRIWEFQIGITLAFLQPRLLKINVKNLGRTLTSFAIILILLSQYNLAGILSDDKSSTILGIIGGTVWITNAIHYFGIPAKGVISRTLATIGDYSYSINLWHWPFIVIGNTLFPNLQWISFWSAILSLLPSFLSYRLIERGFKKYSATRRHYWRPLIFLISASLIGTLALGYGAKRAWRMNSSNKITNSRSIADNCAAVPNGPPGCYFPASKSKGIIISLGDSQVNANSRTLVEEGNARGFTVVLMGFSGCEFVISDQNSHDPCAMQNTRTISYIKKRSLTSFLYKIYGTFLTDPKLTRRQNFI